MRITSVRPGNAHGDDLVDLVKLHDVMWNERERAKNAASAAPGSIPVPAANAAPLSAALVHPSRRPANLARFMPTRGRKAGASRPEGRYRPVSDGVNAEPPDWERMASDDRRGKEIPRNDLFGVPMEPASVHRQRVRDLSGQAPRAAGQTPADTNGIGTVSQLASRAIRGRERFLNLMARLSTPVPSRAAAI